LQLSKELIDFNTVIYTAQRSHYITRILRPKSRNVVRCSRSLW